MILWIFITADECKCFWFVYSILMESSTKSVSFTSWQHRWSNNFPKWKRLAALKLSWVLRVLEFIDEDFALFGIDIPLFFIWQDILENDDIQLDLMFIASIVFDIIRVRDFGHLYVW